MSSINEIKKNVASFEDILKISSNMSYVVPKKSLGQHFLKDHNIARKIVGSLRKAENGSILEIGPGMGILTRYLMEGDTLPYVIDIDRDSIAYLHENFPALGNRIIEGDFLEYDLNVLEGSLWVIGNFPYNISSQIFFKVLAYKEKVIEVVGMVQKEVAERIAAPPGSKTYGILSVLLQAYYTIEYLFTVSPQVFAPPPKVQSAVIRLVRNQTVQLDCNERLFFNVVKTAFNQRRKTLHNSLKSLMNSSIDDPIFQLRPEQLNVEGFIRLTQMIEKQR